MSRPTETSFGPAVRRLVELMRLINFGRIENLTIQAGEPIFDPPPRVVREIKFGAERRPPRDVGIGDFEPKVQVHELVAELTQIGDGVIEVLEIRHGLPFRLVIAEPLTERGA